MIDRINVEYENVKVNSDVFIMTFIYFIIHIKSI